jgi:hypothetical protein
MHVHTPSSHVCVEPSLNQGRSVDVLLIHQYHANSTFILLYYHLPCATTSRKALRSYGYLATGLQKR